MGLYIISLFLLVAGVSGRKAAECTDLCNDMRREVLTMEICKEAKKTLPKPKVGDYCSIAMEQGFSDVCLPLCMQERVVSRIAAACRGAAVEQPRPTVRRWCEHGYMTSYQMTLTKLHMHFDALEPEPIIEEPITVIEETKQEVAAVPADEPKKIESARIMVTIGDRPMDLVIYEGQSAEDAVIDLCRNNDMDHDVSGCIRHLLPLVLEQMHT